MTTSPRSPADPLAWLFALEQHGIKLGLANIRALAAALDHPERAFAPILVAGTNGKGSVAAMIERGLRAAGYRTGLYTSPHLVRLAERIAVAGRPVSESTLAAGADGLRALVDRLRAAGRLEAPPTFFEATTAMALARFRAAEIQVAVLEVGMGGRFDATNVARPVAVAIPSIDLDHERFLGSTIEEIAFEKAGVIDPGAVVVSGEPKPAAREVLRRIARERGARFVDAGAGAGADLRARIREGRSEVERLRTPRGRYGPLTLALRGRHQLRNAVVAVRVLEELGAAGLAVPATAIERALTEVRWPGRLDLRERGPGRRVLLDAAHNVAAAAAFGAYVREIAPEGLPLVFGTLRDKDAAGMVRAIGSAASRFVCTPAGTPRERPAAELAELVRRVRPGTPVDVARGPLEALAEAWRHGPLAGAAGSIYLVGSLIEGLEPVRPGPPVPDTDA
ncbi:MAG: Mur ligase family protein [Acidobacteria bacterium]|nr:Mur ligase family protein [Acidobacteriota bacterium]